ncbi:hypothetical protein [Kitasatospora sp. NPDC058190]|uniref:hypothetical protein n=1 Tax=Kitasatospora sp. NPDC058190 TaxID=3346371 RepID=UPI0036DA8A5E
MLTTYDHPALRRVDWVADLLTELREADRPHWVLFPTFLTRLDAVGLRQLVARAQWPGGIDEPAAVWLVGDEYRLSVSPDGEQWRELRPAPHGLDPTLPVPGGFAAGFLGAHRAGGAPEVIASFAWPEPEPEPEPTG